MNGRERIMAALHGARPDMVPFSPNLHQWFYERLASGALPPELAGADHPWDALRRLGADILDRWDTGSATVVRSPGSSEEYHGHSPCQRVVVTAFNRYPPGRRECRRTFPTPHGTLSECWTYSPEAGADFQSEFCWKTWDDFRAVRWLLESREYSFDAALFKGWVERLGQDGVAMASITQSPLKTFYWLAGGEMTHYFIRDHPEEMAGLAAIHEAKALELLRGIAGLPEAEVFLSLDNLDSLFYPPRYYAAYCDSFFSRAAEVVHSRGKIFVVHACGRNRRLLSLAGRSRVDCLEGITPPPLGDVDLSRARKSSGWSNFTVDGGIEGHLAGAAGDDIERRIHEYARTLFDAMGDRRHFIFGSSCSTPVRAPWVNLKYFRDAARQYGGAAH